jgi:small subunit ribosomal protein S6
LNQYELLYIVDPRLPDEELQPLQERISNFITTNSGEITEASSMGVRRLAYPIGALEEGRYEVVQFKADSSILTPFKNQLKLIQPIVRFMIIKEDE